MLGSKRKSAEVTAEMQAKDQKRRAILRDVLVSRHSELATLEEKAGIIKLRYDPLSDMTKTPFGVARRHPVSQRCRSLSRPKAPASPSDPMDYSELRGLLSAQHPTAVAKVKRSISHLTSLVPVNDHTEERKSVVDVEGREEVEALAKLQAFTTSKGFCGKDLEAVYKEDSRRTRLAHAIE